MGTALLVSRYGSKWSGFATPIMKSWNGKRSACIFKWSRSTSGKLWGIPTNLTKGPWTSSRAFCAFPIGPLVVIGPLVAPSKTSCRFLKGLSPVWRIQLKILRGLPSVFWITLSAPLHGPVLFAAPSERKQKNSSNHKKNSSNYSKFVKLQKIYRIAKQIVK